MNADSSCTAGEKGRQEGSEEGDDNDHGRLPATTAHQTIAHLPGLLPSIYTVVRREMPGVSNYGGWGASSVKRLFLI